MHWLIVSSIALLISAVGCATENGLSETDAQSAQAGEADGHAHTYPPRRFLPDGAGAPLFNDLGSYRMPISSSSDLAQRYFSQGLLLGYGFNHAEALRSYKEAFHQDPACGICAWGEAYVLGPNINKPMDDADVPAAFEASQRALKHIEAASPVERALIEALSQRYSPTPVADRSELDLAYANAMRGVAKRFPDHLDVQTLSVEAVMDTMPWDYYEDPATPKPAAREALAALESVIARNPEHPGALHLYIHMVEPSSEPDRAEFAADQLGDLSPGAGHLVHMPSHIYLRIGRYHDASLANEEAAAADEAYITQCRAQGFYPAAYYPHNIHFLYASAAFEGRSAVSIGAANKLSANMTPEIVAEVPITEEFVPMSLFALARFSRWEELASTPAPDSKLRYATGVWHYVQGMAHAATGRGNAAQRDLLKLEEVASEPALQDFYFASGSTPTQLLSLAARVLQARIASEAGSLAAAITPLRAAVAMQDALPYTEPPPWYFPTREALGQALLADGRAAEAEAVFREQLEHTPRNGWSLHGLVASLRAQGKADALAAAEARRQEAWKRADFSLALP